MHGCKDLLTAIYVITFNISQLKYVELPTSPHHLHMVFSSLRTKIKTTNKIINNEDMPVTKSERFEEDSH